MQAKILGDIDTHPFRVIVQRIRGCTSPVLNVGSEITVRTAEHRPYHFIADYNGPDISAFATVNVFLEEVCGTFHLVADVDGILTVPDEEYALSERTV